MTNADKIRAMDDVALATWLTHIEMLARRKQSTGDRKYFFPSPLLRAKFEADWLKWLKEEATERATTT